MFTPPSVNQIASTYQGNPAPLNQKVDTDRKQNGGIPKDLRQLMAAYDLSQGRQNMGIQQALQIPTNMPTVAQDVQERARQAMQARMMQQAQEMQRKNGMPNMVPPGTPRPPMQAQGLDSLESNVGEEYAHGGIIGNTQHFDGTSSSFVKDLASFKDKIVGAFTETDEDKTARLLQQRLQQEGAPIGYFTKGSEDYDKKSALRSFVIDNPTVVKNPEFQANPLAFMEKSKNVNTAQDVNAGKSSYIPNAEADAIETSKLFNLAATPSAPAVAPTKVNAPRPSATQGTQGSNRVNADSAPMPGGLQGLASSLATPGGDYTRKILNQDENVMAAARRALYDKEVGSRDLSIYDQMAEELKGRKERLNAPKAGYDATMELLEQIAASGGRNWMEAGSKGVAGQRALQKSRLSEQDLLMEKILDLGAKKSDAQFAERKGMFDLTQAEKDRVIKEKTDAAKQLNLSEDETRKLIEQGIQKELDRKNELKKAGVMSAANRDDLMNRAAAIRAENKGMSVEESIKRASIAMYAGQAGVAEGKLDNEKEKRIAAIRKDYGTTMKFFKPDSPVYKQQLALMEKAIAEERGAPGINALPAAASSGTVPPPSGYRRD